MKRDLVFKGTSFKDFIDWKNKDKKIFDRRILVKKDYDRTSACLYRYRKFNRNYFMPISLLLGLYGYLLLMPPQLGRLCFAPKHSRIVAHPTPPGVKDPPHPTPLSSRRGENRESRIANRASRIPYPVSRIPYRDFYFTTIFYKFV